MRKVWKIVLVLSLIGNLFIVYVGYKALGYRTHINHFLDKYTHVVSEFSCRSVYEEDNKRLASDIKVDNRVVFLGTQVTEKWDLKKHFKGYEAINRGISGQRVSGFLLRFKPDVIELYPEVVVIEVSSYNFRPENTVKEIEDYVSCMAELARAHDIEPILTTIIPPRKGIEMESYSIMDSLSNYNSWLVRYCQENGYKYADFSGVLADNKGYLREGLSADAIDPNEDGYMELSRVILDVINEQNNTW